MKRSGIAILLVLSGLGSPAFADDTTSTISKPPVEIYTYETKLDIKKVIVITDVESCGPGKAVMTYEDSHDQQHTMQYLVMGSGCSGG